MSNESLIISPNAYQAGAILGHRPSSADATKVIPIEIPFTRNSTAMRRNSAGLWESVSNNVPRLHYPVGGGCPSWLFEAEATNVVLNSLGNAATYSVAGGSSLSDFSLSTPFSGVTSAIKVSTIANFFSGCSKTISRASAINVNWCIVKKSTLDYMGMVDITGGGVVAWFNISNGTLGTVNAGYTARITSEGDGWYRCELTKNTADAAAVFQIMFTNTDNSSIGAVGDSYLCFAQNELGSAATSPIITAGAAVTRLADNVSKTGASEIIGQTEGTIFVDVVINSENNPSANIINGAKNTNSSFAILRIKATKAIRAFIYNSTVLKANITGGSYNLGDRLKIAYAYKSGDSVLYVNGVQIGTSADAISFPATLSELNWDDATTYFGYQEAENINETRISKTRLPNAELAALTTI